VIRIAQLSCGSEYSGIQKEIERAAETVGAKIVYPEVSLEDILDVEKKFGVKVASGDLNLAMARAVRIVENPDLADAVIVMTCFRCAEAAIIRSEIRKFIHERSRIPVLSYSSLRGRLQRPFSRGWRPWLRPSNTVAFWHARGRRASQQESTQDLPPPSQ